MFRHIQHAKSVVLLSAVLAVATPLRPAQAQDAPRSYDDTPITRPASSSQNPVEIDRANLDAARRRLDQIVAARDRAQRELDDLKSGVRVSSDPAQAKADLTRAMADKADLQNQVKAIQQRLDDAQAKADKAHEEALQKFEGRDDFKALAADFDKARMDLKGPTDRVLDRLQQTREFMELVDAARAAKQAEDKLQADKTADPKALRDAEQAFIAADNKVQEQEEKALTADADVLAGRKRVDAVRDQMRAMRDQFEQDLLKDPTFAPLADDVRQQQEALQAGNDDLRKADAKIAAAQAVVDGKPAATAMQGDPAAVRDAQARLDQINKDYDETRRDVDRFAARLQDDQAVAAGGTAVQPDDQPVLREPVVERVVEQPVYEPVYTPVYTSYDPYYAYGGYYAGPYFGLSLSYADYCARPRCYYGYSGYYGGCYGGYWGLYASYYYNHDHHGYWGHNDYHHWDSHHDYGHGGYAHGGSYGHGGGYGGGSYGHGGHDYGYGRNYSNSYAYGHAWDKGNVGSGSYGSGLRSSSFGRSDVISRGGYGGSSYGGRSGSYSSSSSHTDRYGYATVGAYSGLDRARMSDSRSSSSYSSRSLSGREGMSASDYSAYRARVERRASEGSSGGRTYSSSSSSSRYSSPTFRSLSSRSDLSSRSSSPSYSYHGSSFSSRGSSFSSSSSRSYRSPTFSQPSFRSSSSHSSSWGGGHGSSFGSSHFSSGGSSFSHGSSGGHSSGGSSHSGGHSSHGGR